MEIEEHGFSMGDELRRLQKSVDDLKDENKSLKQELSEVKKPKIIKQEEAKLLSRVHKCKMELKETKLEKTGYNAHNKYSYFELSDFLPSLEKILYENGLSTYFHFQDNMAYLTVFEIESGICHTWSTKCISAKAKENGYDVGVHMKGEQAVQTYARRTLYLQAFDIVEENTIEKEGENKNKKASKPKPTAPKKQFSPVKPIKEEPQEEITAERIQDILKEAEKILDKYQQDKPEKDRKPFTWEYARFTIRKLCRNDREYKACKNSLVFKKASDIEEGRK